MGYSPLDVKKRHIAKKMKTNTTACQVKQEIYQCDKRFMERKNRTAHLNSIHKGRPDYCDPDEELFQALLLKTDEESAKMKDSIGQETAELPPSHGQEDFFIELCIQKEEFEYFQKEAEYIDNNKDLKALEDLRARLLTQIGIVKPRSRGWRTKIPLRPVRRGRVTKTVSSRGRSTGSRRG